jgi:hypothetical protein
VRSIAAKFSRAAHWLRAAVALFAFAAVAPVACVFDPSDRCGPNEVIYGDNERCVCVEGAALTPAGCVLCGEHEMPGGTGCVCAPGYTRAPGETACEAEPLALGAACTQTCDDPTFNHCELNSQGSGYCTSTGCTGDDCSGGYACDTGVSPSVCRRPPTGAGQSCTSPADCAGTEATYCDSFMTHSCIVEGCSLSPNDCFTGSECCDLSQFGVPKPICVPTGGCPT